MKVRIISCFLTLLLVLSGCAPAQNPAVSATQEDDGLTLVATTYPIYLFASAITEGVEGVRVVRLNTGEASCLHDYTLTVDDMKKLEGADIIALNGAGLEDFMDDALAASQATVIDCSQGVELLENFAHHHAEGEEDHGHFDPHIWMDPDNAVIMMENLASGLCETDPAHEEAYQSNNRNTALLSRSWKSEMLDILHKVGGPKITGLITFHDGFQYFAKAFELPLLAAIEEEAGSEASAHEMLEITQLVRDQQLPVVFTEVNGSDATAKAIARETGCQVAQLTMLMDGPDGALSNYYDGLMDNMLAIVNGFSGEEVLKRGIA